MLEDGRCCAIRRGVRGKSENYSRTRKKPSIPSAATSMLAD
jgi:hypothetical protein